MNPTNSPLDSSKQLGRRTYRKAQLMRTIQTLSRIVTAAFIIALMWAIYEAVANDNPLPVWTWLGLLVLLAMVIGVGVAVLVYRSVSSETGPFDLRPSSHVTGELRSDPRRVEAGAAVSLRAEIKMTQGVLRVKGGTAAAMEADFTYDDADWKAPEVDYAVNSTGQGNLVVKQRATHRPAMRQGRSEWDIRLNERLATDLKVRFGAGKAELRLSGMTLEHLHVESGVGELVVDLSGEWLRSTEIFLKAGIGDTVLRLPSGTGVRLRSSVGMGSMQAPGLTWDGDAYANALHGQSPVTLDVVVEGGVGKVAVELVQP